VDGLGVGAGWRPTAAGSAEDTGGRHKRVTVLRPLSAPIQFLPRAASRPLPFSTRQVVKSVAACFVSHEPMTPFGSRRLTSTVASSVSLSVLLVVFLMGKAKLT
jgi:hypothetical protein